MVMRVVSSKQLRKLASVLLWVYALSALSLNAIPEWLHDAAGLLALCLASSSSSTLTFRPMRHFHDNAQTIWMFVIIQAFFSFFFFLPEIQNPHTTDSRDPSGWAGVGQASICLWFWLIPCSVWRQSSLMKWMILIICHVACGVHPYCALHSARASLDTVIPLADSKWTGIIKGKNNKRKCFVILTVGQDV